MAKVALTNGRDEMWERRLGRDSARPARTRDLFRLADFMLQRRDFALHLAQANMSRSAARFVEEINDRAWNAANEDDQKAE